MPKPTGKRKYSGSGYGEKDFQRELAQADKRQLQEERARKKDTAGKTQRMNELNKQYREINSYVGPELPGDRAARERGYYANLAQYGADYGDRAAYDSGYQRYKAAMQSIQTTGAQTARTAAGTARMARAGDMIQDVLRRGTRPFEMLGGKRAADFAAEDLAMQGSRLDRDRRTYTQMARGAQMAGDHELLRSARQGLADSSGRYADAMTVYGEKSREARNSYLRELEQTNKGAYYGETHGTQEIEGRLRELRRKREQLDSMDVTWTDGMGGPAETKQDYVSARGQELDAEIAQWEAALRHRNAIDKADEMRRVAESITSAPNFRELSEVGRAMVEARNQKARETMISPNYTPDDPDDNRQFAIAERKEREALLAAGYVSDLDSSYIPEDVKPVYYALFAQSPAKAKEWAEYWRGVGEDEYWRQIYEESGEDAGSRLGAFIQGTFANTVAGLNPFGEGGQYAAKLGSTMIGGGAAGLTEKGLFNTGAWAGEIDVPIFGKQTLGSAYQLGSSMLQSTANATLAKMTGGAAALVGGAGTILLGSSAAAQDYQEKIEQGWDENSAKWHALAAGAAEAGFEYLSLDKLVNQDISRGFIRNVLLQGGIEASEEVSTTLANRISDAAISALSGYDNSIQQRAKELMSFGYEAGTADKMARQEWLTELLNDALGGFLSGGLMTGGQYAMLPVYKAIGAVDDFNRFTRALSSTGETALTGTAELTRGEAGAEAEQIGASLNAETVEAARRIMGEEITDSSTAADASAQNDAAEQKQSRRELRRQAREQRKQSTRDGAVYEQAVQKVQQAIDQRGVGAVNEVYAETVEQYGEAAKGIAQEAITRAVSRQLSEAQSVADIDRMTQAENAAPEVRAAIQQAKDLRSLQLFAQNGDTEAAERAIQSRRNSGRGSGALKLEAEYSGEDGSIKRAEITGVTANAESVKLSNGETVSVKKLANLDADTRDVLDRIAYMEVGPAADILWKSYLAEAGSGTDGYRYVMDWATAYDQGRQGSVSLKEAQGRSSLSAETVKNAYELGEQYGKDLDAKQKAELAEKMKITQKGATGRAGTVNTEQIGGMRLSEDQSKQLEIVKRLAEAFGIDVEVFASDTRDVTVNGETRRQFVGENGRYQDGKIWLDINAGLNYTDDVGSGLVATMGHELTHFIQQYAPDEYRAYKRFVLATIRQQEGSQGLERLIREKIQRSKGQNLSRSAAEDEVVADAAQTVLTDSQALRQMAEQEPTLFRKVLDWIKDFFDSIRDALSGSPRMSEEARLFRALEADVRQTFGELWDKGITEAVRVHDQVGSLGGESQGQNSDRDTEYLELAKDPEKNQERLQEMVDEAAERAGYKYKGYHGTAANFNVFDKEKIGSTYESDEEGFFFTTNENEAEFAAGDAQLKTGNDERIISAYLKIRDPLIVKTKEASGTDYFDAWKYSLLDRMHGYDADGIIIKGTESTTYVVLDSDQIKSADPVTYDDSGNVIPLSERFNTENQDIRYSERDSTGRELSEGQKEYFKDSAIRDSKGNLMVVYHGTKADFNIFDTIGQGGKNGTQEGFGIYLTNEKKVSDSYGDRVIEGYANIKRPATSWKKTIKRTELAKLIKETCMQEARRMVDDGEYDTVKEALFDTWISNYVLTYESPTMEANYRKAADTILGANDNDMDIVQEVMIGTGIRSYKAAMDFYHNELTPTTGIDGFWTRWRAKGQGQDADVILAFDSNQVKNASNKTPTSNPDIRYSERDNFADMTEDQLRDDLRETQQEFYAARKEYQSIGDTEERKKLMDAMVSKEDGAVKRYAEWAKISGYEDAYKRMTAAQERIDKGQKRLSQLVEERMEAEESKAIEKSGLSKAEYFRKQAVKEFGYTPYFYDAGYILPNGKLLNFSGEKGRHFGSRGQDHRAIGQIYANSTGSAAMTRFMNDGNIRIMAESPGLDVSGTTPLTSEQYSTIRKFVNQVRGEEYFNLDFSDERGNTIDSIEYEGRINAERVVNDIKHFFETGEVRHPSGLSAFYSERSYDLPSDLELMDRAAESLSEAGGEEYWKALLEAAPELAEDKAELKSMAKAYREQSRKLDEAEKKLAEARQQLVTTDRKLRTRGISGVTTSILKDLHAGDVKNRNVQQTVTDILTKAYQKGLDAIDAGKSQSEVWDVVYNEGIVKAADYILENATYSEKTSRKWTTVILNKYMTGEEGRYAVLDAISARVVPDWWESRARQPLQQTAADRIVSRVEGRMQKQIDAQTQRAESAEASNRKLREDLDFYKEAQDNAAKQVTFLGEQLEEAREDLRSAKQTDAKERRQKTARIRSLENQLKAKREEAGAWKQMASRNESLLRAALKSKNADLEAQVQRADKAEAALAGQTVNAKAWERNADLYAKQLDKQLEQKAKIVKQLEAQVQREKDILSGKLKPLAMQRLLKAALEEAASKAKEKKEEVFQNYKERKNITALKSRIRNLTADIRKTAASPTERSFLPAHLAGAMLDLLDVLEQGQVDTPKAGTKAASKYYSATDAIRALADAYKQIENDPDYTYSSEFEQDVYDGIVKLANQFVRQTNDGHKYNITANEMSLQELQQVYDTVREIREGFRNAAKLIGMDSSMSTYDYAGKILGHQREIREAKAGKKGKKLRSLYDNIQIDALSPIRAAHMMDGFQDAEFYQLWKQVEDGLGQKNRVIMDSTKRLQSFKTGQNELTYLKALREKSDYGIRDVNGNPVLMTKMQAIQMLMTWQREEANQNLVHMQEGGVIIRDADLISRGRYSDAKKTQQKVKVTPEMIQQIASTMTEWDKGYMKAARDVFSSLLEQSNKVLYTLKRKVHKGEAMYIPEKVADGYLAQEVVKGGEFNLGVKEASATKDLKQKSTLPIIIDGLETMMNRHINDMANYIGLAVPIRNFAKVYNTRTSGIGVEATTVNDEITNTWGDKAGEMMMETLRQVQNGRSYEYQTVLSGLEQKIQSAFVKASLVGKISVFIKQAASYAAAGSVLSQKALDRSQQYIFAIVSAPNGKLARSVYNRIDAITPEHFIRRMGMSMEEIAMDKLSNGPIKGKLQTAGAWLEGKGKVGKAVRRSVAMLNPTNWIQRMDVATTGALVIACERQAKYDGFKRGTPEFDAHVKELYERVIRETQPMYDPMHRPALQKNAGPMARLLFPFRTVPFQNYGQIMDAFGSFQAASKENKKAAAVHFGKTLWANFESALVFAALGMLSYAIMHKPKRYLDDDDELTLESVLKTYGSDVLDVTLGNLLPYGGTELKDFVERWINGDKWYQLMSVGPADLVNETASSILKLKEASDRFSAGELSADGMKNQILNTTMQVTKLLGLPASNVLDIFRGVSAGVDDWKNGQLLWLNDDTVERSNATNARRYAEAWEAGDMEKMQAVIAEMNRNLEKAGKSTDGARDAITKAAKERYEAGEIELAQYADFLRQAGYLEEDKIESKIRDFLRDELVTGDRTEDEVLRLLTELGGLTEDKAWKKVMEWKAKAETGDSEEEDEAAKYSEYDALRDALRSGQKLKDAAKDYLAHGYTEKQVLDAATKDLKARFQAGEVSEDKAIDLLVEYSGKDEDACWKTVQGWIGAMEHPEDEDYSWGQYDAIDEALAGNKEVKGLISELTAHGVKEDSINQHIKGQLVQNYVDGKTNESQLKNQLSRYLGIVTKTDVDKILKDANSKKLYGVAYSSLDEEYRAGKIGKAEIKQALMKQGGLSSGEAEQKIRWYDLQKANPKLEISEAVCNAWYDGTTNGSQKYGHESAKNAGMSIERYVEARKYLDTVKDSNGNGTGEDEVIRALAGMSGLTAREKDALYYERYKGGARKGIYKTW